MSTHDDPFAEGWWLMSVPQLERYLAAWRSRNPELIPAEALRLTREEAIEFRNRGNQPDELDRSLRLVLRVEDEADLRSLDSRRLIYEPDAHAAPSWRVEGSRPVNVVPLRRPGIATSELTTWEDDPAMGAMEREWQEKGSVRGVVIPEEFRGFVFKTIVALEATGSQITVRTIADSVARWLDADQVERLRSALEDANPG